MPRIVTVINDLLISYHTGTRKGFGVNIRDNRESDRGRRVFPLPDLPLPYVVDRAGILNYFRSFFRTQDGEGYIPAGSLVRGSEAEKIYHLFSMIFLFFVSSHLGTWDLSLTFLYNLTKAFLLG